MFKKLFKTIKKGKLKVEICQRNLQDIKKNRITRVYRCRESSGRTFYRRKSWMYTYPTQVSNKILKRSTSRIWYSLMGQGLPVPVWAFAYEWKWTPTDEWWKWINDKNYTQWRLQDVFKNYSFSSWTASFEDMPLAERDTDIYPCKLQVHQLINDFDKRNRVWFARYCQSEVSNNPKPFPSVVFSDECKFFYWD